MLDYQDEQTFLFLNILINSILINFISYIKNPEQALGFYLLTYSSAIFK